MVKLDKKRQFSSDDIVTLNVGFDRHTSNEAVALPSSLPIKNPRSLWLTANWVLHSKSSFPLLIILLFVAFSVQSAAASPSPDEVDCSGTLHLSYITLRPPQNIPKIILEWAALVPLTVYLASNRSNYELAAEVSLRGRLSVSLIPKLWALGGLANLLQHREVFFDSANAEGETLKVFDVQNGRVFRCYNSPAASLVADAASEVKPLPPILEPDLVKRIHDNSD